MTHDAGDTLREYVEAFATLDPEAIVPFYHLPCMFIAPFGISFAADADAVRRTASALIEHARSQRYRRTEFLGLHMQELAANLVSFSGVFVRFNAKDDEIGRFGFFYIMRNEGAGWRIVVAVAHDPPKAED